MMRESVIYPDILQQGLEQKAQEIATNMLNEGVAIALIVCVTATLKKLCVPLRFPQRPFALKKRLRFYAKLY
jgi:hypothetical protein